MIFHKAIGSVFGIGFLPKGGGSVAAAAYCLLMFFLPFRFEIAEFLSVIFVLVIGLWSSSGVEKEWGTDSNKVVIDEVAGMMISLAFIQKEWLNLILGFVFFRFFDILKPLGIRRMERLPSGWGVMADDVLSGVYSWILLKALTEAKFI